MKRLVLAVLISLNAGAAMAADVPFDFEVLQYRAKTLAAKPYAPRASKVPKALQDLSYDLYREIRFDTNRSWWRHEQLPFQLQFFHPGFVHENERRIVVPNPPVSAMKFRAGDADIKPYIGLCCK